MRIRNLLVMTSLVAVATVIGRILVYSYARQDLAGVQTLIATYAFLLILAPAVTYTTLWCIVPRFNIKTHWTSVVGLVILEEIALLGAIVNRIKYIVG